MSIIFDFRQIRERCETLGFDYIVPDEEPEWQRKTIVQVKLPELITPNPSDIRTLPHFMQLVIWQPWKETKEKILKHKMPDILSRNENFWLCKESYERLSTQRFSIWDHREELGIEPFYRKEEFQ